MTSPVLDRLTYLNTASVGLVPASVVTPRTGFEFGLAQAGTTGMDEDTEIGIRHGAAALSGASPDTIAIAIATSFTEAMNQVAWWLRPGCAALLTGELDFSGITEQYAYIIEAVDEAPEHLVERRP